MAIGFWTFVLVFFCFSFLLAFVELMVKSTPVTALTAPDYEKSYGVPPGLDKLEYCAGSGWRHRDTGKLAMREEVEGAGLVWREAGGSTTPPGTPPGSPKGAAAGRGGAEGAGAMSAVAAADKKMD